MGTTHDHPDEGHLDEGHPDPYRLLVEHIGDVVLHLRDGRAHWVSPSVSRVLGWDPLEARELATGRFIHPDDRPKARALRERAEHGDAATGEFRVEHRNGSYRWIELTLAPMPSTDGAAEFVGILRDVTDRVAAQQAVTASRARLRTILDSLLDAHLLLEAERDAEGRITRLACIDANPAAARVTGRSRDELLGSRLADVLPDHLGTVLDEACRAVVGDGTPLVLDAQPAPVDGGIAWFDVRAVRIDDGLSVTFRDVTERELRDQERADLRARHALADERDRMARDLHDGAIQQVLAISMALEATARRAPEPLGDELRALVAAHEETVRLLRATVLGLSQSASVLEDPETLIRDVVAQAERSLGFAPEVEVVGPMDDLDDPVIAGHLVLTLREMLSNVARHARATTARVEVAVADGHVAVTVGDNGIGPGETWRRGNGIDNLHHRAGVLDGTFEITAAPGGGTQVRWQAPLR
jgi:PAS domain S-box-containing protein